MIKQFTNTKQYTSRRRAQLMFFYIVFIYLFDFYNNIYLDIIILGCTSDYPPRTLHTKPRHGVHLNAYTFSLFFFLCLKLRTDRTFTGYGNQFITRRRYICKRLEMTKRKIMRHISRYVFALKF